eukprot:gene31694-6897_t
MLSSTASSSALTRGQGAQKACIRPAPRHAISRSAQSSPCQPISSLKSFIIKRSSAMPTALLAPAHSTSTTTSRRCITTAATADAAPSLPDACVSVVLLAGGVGKRMGASIPKQYLELKGQPIATYSLDMFAKMREVAEIVIVCDPSWKDVFEKRFPNLPKSVQFKWALPGAERQDSVFNGLQEISPTSELVAIHDSARPLTTPADAAKCFMDGWTVGAAVLGVPVKPTIKEVDADLNVTKTLVRSKLYEVQTPQVIRPNLLREGFELVKRENLEVTDDVSIIEALGKPVKITIGSYTNIKITTPEDMSVGVGFLEEAEAKAKAAEAKAAVNGLLIRAVTTAAAGYQRSADPTSEQGQGARNRQAGRPGVVSTRATRVSVRPPVRVPSRPASGPLSLAAHLAPITAAIVILANPAKAR